MATGVVGVEGDHLVDKRFCMELFGVSSSTWQRMVKRYPDELRQAIHQHRMVRWSKSKILDFYDKVVSGSRGMVT